MEPATQRLEILLVEDNAGDVYLFRRALWATAVPHRIHVVGDGEEALEFLRRQAGHADAVVPDIVVLDLNLPRKDGREVLREIKQDAELSQIPVVVFSSSAALEDVVASYRLYANCYVTKPSDVLAFSKAVASVSQFWSTVASLPRP